MNYASFNQKEDHFSSIQGEVAIQQIMKIMKYDMSTDILIFFKEEFLKTDIKLPEIGNYGVGMIFLPPEKNRANSAIKSVEEAIKKEGQYYFLVILIQI